MTSTITAPTSTFELSIKGVHVTALVAMAGSIAAIHIVDELADLADGTALDKAGLVLALTVTTDDYPTVLVTAIAVFRDYLRRIGGDRNRIMVDFI